MKAFTSFSMSRPAIRLLLFVTVAVGLVDPIRAVNPLVQLEDATVTTGGTLAIHLVALNSTSTPVTHVFPAQVEGQLFADTTLANVIFKPAGSIPEGGVTVAPHGFARITYQAVVPKGLSGTVHLDLTVENAPSFIIQVAAGSTAESVETEPIAKKFSVREAMDHQPRETSFFKQHVFPYEPFYFIAGPDAPSVKFQVSIKYRLVNTEVGDDGEAEGWLYRHAPWMAGLHLAYTQRSLWDIQAESAPFLDSSYMPELLYERPNLIDPEHGWLERIGAQVGFKHESNGKDGMNSRSLNIGYVRVPFVFGDEEDFYVSLEPRAWFYFGDLSDNPDLTDYRGYVDLRLKAGWARGLQVAGWLRSGKDFKRGSAQVDLTYPLHNLLSRSFSFYLQAQYFNGYGESLLYYNQRGEIWRVGIGLYR